MSYKNRVYVKYKNRNLRSYQCNSVTVVIDANKGETTIIREGLDNGVENLDEIKDITFVPKSARNQCDACKEDG